MVKRSTTWVAVGITSSILALLPATAVAGGNDQQSDHDVLAAYHGYVEAVAARIPAARQAESAYVSSISKRCAGVLGPLKNASNGSVNEAALFDFGEEVGGSTFVVAYKPARGPFARMAATVRKLDWSSQQTAKTVTRYFTAEARLLALAPSDVCTDAQALVASHGQTIPPGTSQWLARLYGADAAEGSAAGAFRKVLEEFAAPADRALLASDVALLGSVTRKLAGVAASRTTKLATILGAT